MIFSRTNSGLSNFHAFCDVDFLVYSEGGTPSKSEEDIECTWSIDSIFWKSVFLRFLPNVKIKIKSLGSKEFVRPYAEKIAKNSINNSIAVLDRDYDAHRGELIKHHRILYTHGYSWENDACRSELLISTLDSIHPDGKIPEKYAQNIKLRYNNFLKSITRVVIVDLLCGLVRIKGVDRERFWSLIDTSNSLDYKIKKEQFKKLITEIKSRRTEPLRYLGKEPILPATDCYGKMISMFCYSIFCEYYKEITGCKNIPRHFADKMIAEAIRTANLDEIPQIKDHYEKMLSQIL
ncbi:hypothetical protein C4K19_3781 [Pseudomonas chlororaphis subsp. aurantiaca]|uniref:DUF4435 domain-containing protein n=1 Tax=Pseudomonas chlororaphis TaxID=587753 RepID=UPI000F563EB2|nr:DUF4435 domain-containing protein [Pseudomonas chlororaphis]AZD55565.1 hypothetical protein C4K19_3781 [Pseudomonas chlororaphis subsp. aurantiaca]